MIRIFLSIALFALAAAGCNTPSGESGSARIKLGDSNLIVTENDPKYVQDFKAGTAMPEAEKPVREDRRDTVAAPARPEIPAAKPQVPAAAGFSVDFGDVTVILPGVSARSFGKKTNASASYQLASGNLSQSSIQISGGTLVQVQQQSKSKVTVTANDREYDLPGLSESSGWKALPVSGNSARIRLDNPDGPSASASKIQSEIRRTLHRRLSSRDERQLLRNVGSRRNNPLEETLTAVTWKITVKNAAGKTVKKELRFDLL